MSRITKNKTTTKSLPLVIGFFDGIHQGHLKLFNKLAKKKFNILTFINVPNKSNQFIYDDHTRINNLKELNPLHLYILDLKINNYNLNEFITYVKTKINPSQIIVGSDFKFGKDRLYNIKHLQAVFDVKVIKVDNRFKTSLIKQQIKEGNVHQANQSLDVPYHISGEVIHGKANGRKFGYRTVNIMINQKMINPKNGSYLGYTYVNHKKYPSAIYVFDHLFESHLFNFNQDIYGEIVKIELIKYHSAPKKVNGFDELKALITNKTEQIRKIFKDKLTKN